MTQKRKIQIVSFFLPVFLTLVVMAVLKVYPFGENTFLIWDMDWQYSSFFVYLHDVLHNDVSPWYSFSRAIGGNMAGVWSYYLISPFNLLFYFFDETNIYVGICIVLFLKIGMTGFCMQFCLSQKQESMENVIFSTAYALSAFVTAYFFNIMWLDGVMLLPLMVVGIWRLCEEHHSMLYTVTIGLSVITNFYIGYMLCLFSVLYFGCYFFFFSEKKKNIWTIGRYVVSSLLGGMLSAVVALPTLYAMQDGKGTIDIAVLKNTTTLLDVSKLFCKSFAGTIEPYQITNGSPLLYCGVFSVLFAVAFFFTKHVSWKKKAGYAILIFSLLVSFLFYNLYCVWHGFNMPNGSPYRFSFLYTFVIVLLASESYQMLESRVRQMQSSEKTGSLFAPVLVSSVILLVSIFLLRLEFFDLERKGVIAFNVILLLFYPAVSLFVKQAAWRKGVFLVGMSAELLANALFLYQNSTLYESTTVTQYKDYINRVSDVVEEVKKQEGLFRVVMTQNAYRTVNDSFLFQLNGLDSYTSVEQKKIQEMAFHLGYYQNMVFGIHYKDGTTHAAESFLGVKYQITSKELKNGYEKRKETEDIAWYENKTALPMAFFVEEGIVQINNEDYNCFAYQNAIFQALSFTDSLEEEKQPIFSEITYQVAGNENCTQDEDGNWLVLDPEKESYVEYWLDIEKAGNYYVQYLGSSVAGIEFVLNDTTENLQEQQNIVKRLGNLTPKDTVLLRCYFNGGGVHSMEKVYVCFEDEFVLANYARQVQKQQVDISYESDSHIQIQCENETKEDTYLLCTIPYEKGWQITMDGVPITAHTVLGNYMMVKVAPGEHLIEMKFLPQGLFIGSLLTIIAILLLSVFCRKSGKKS